MTHPLTSRPISALLLSAFIILFSTISCGKKESAAGSEFQRWQDNNQAIAGLFDISSEAFFGESRRMPGMLDELKSSGWLWFYPTVPAYAPGFEILDRELADWSADQDKVYFKFTATGYECKYFVRKTSETQEHQQESIGKADVLSGYEAHRSFDPNGLRYNVYNAGYRRQFLAFNLARLFMRRYYTENNSFPETGSELYNNWCEPLRDVISAIPIIPAGNPYSVYVGFKAETDRGIMYFEIVRPDSTVYTQLRVFKLDAQGNALTIIETTLPETEQIAKEDTVMFIDSSVQNWGIQ
ncbi:MAG: hypothetical protein NTY09_09700 [bacterium]|nr:hypothetical protein [bacterium]